MGAGVALMAAAQDPRIGALVVDGAYPRLAGILAAWGRLRGLPDGLARGLASLVLVAGSIRARRRLDRANPIDTAELVTVPVLFIHSQRDPFVSDADIDMLAARTTGLTDIWHVPDAGHREAFMCDPAAYNQRVEAWFAQHL
jgi:pimeloyl-ACP methyl ester carboxylesterase